MRDEQVNIKTKQLIPSSFCTKCNSELLTDGIKDYSVACAYSQSCPTKELNNQRLALRYDYESDFISKEEYEEELGFLEEHK